MGVVRLPDLAMRKLGDSWFVKVIPGQLFVQLDGPLATLWEALLQSETESEALRAFLASYNNDPQAAADAPHLLLALREQGLLSSSTQSHGISEVHQAGGQPHSDNVTIIDVQDAMYRMALALERPLLAEYEMTYRCNLRCLYCYQPLSLKLEKRDELSPEEISAMLDDFARAGVFFLIVTGGECTIHRNFGHVIREARARLMDVSVLTNGTSLMPETLELLTSARVSEVKVSVYGASAEEYGRFTRFPSAFGRVMSNLAKLRDSGIRVVAKVIVTTVQKDGFRRSLAQLKDLGIDVEVSAHVMPAMDGDLSPLQYRVDTDTLTELFREGALRSGARRACTAGLSKFRVSPEGFITACELQRTPLGSIRNQPISEILASCANSELLTILDRAGRRAQCDEDTKSLPCPALAKLEHGSWEAKSAEAMRWTAAASKVGR